MISLCILIIFILAIVCIILAIIGGAIALFIDPIVCVLIIIGVIKLIKHFKDKSE